MVAAGFLRAACRACLNFLIVPDGVEGIASCAIRRSGMYCSAVFGSFRICTSRGGAMACPGLGATTAQTLAQALVGVGHDGGHGVGRVAAEQRFDLDHRNVVAAADDHVLAVADGAQMATKPVPGLEHHSSFSPGRR